MNKKQQNVIIFNMKISGKYTRWQPMMYVLLTLISPSVVAYNNAANSGQVQAGESTPVTDNMRSIAPENSPIVTSREKASFVTPSSEKKILNEEPRNKLSTFFAIGIAINIIMASVFAWWFLREWRKSQNIRGSKREN